MKRNFYKMILTAVFACVISTSAVFAQSAYEIMKKNQDLYKGDTAVYQMKMTLAAKGGKSRIREVAYYFKDYGATDKTVMVFLTPKDVEGVGYLMWGYDEEGKDDDTWLYMPKSGKERRISGSDKDNYFMGTDFTYDDIGDRDLSKDDFNILGEENIEGFDCWKIECIPHDKTERSSRRIYWIRKDCYVCQKGELYNRQNKLERVLTISGITQIDGIWTSKKMFMENLASGHSTLLEMNDITYNKPLSDSMFTVAELKKGRIGR